ncbi:MAG: helix-turn-helix transcriptional regulator [bacterium]|nr:helix-turn-helix transcriptional regulator [bacterium]
MLRTIRSVLGPSWHPGQILLQTFRRLETEALFDTSRTELRFDRPETVIVIDDTDIASSLGGSRPSDLGRNLHHLSENTEHALAELIESHLGDHRLSLEFMARICNIHPRTLQRMLASQRTTFSDLVARQRVAAATKWLKDSDKPIADLSYLLGYAHQSRFSRAFRRHTGLTPIGYRRASDTL